MHTNHNPPGFFAALRAPGRWFVGLWLLLTRRIDTPNRATAVSYAQETAVMLWLMTGVCVVEIIAVDLLVPWDRLPTGWWWVRWAVLGLGVLGALASAAFVATQSTRPHYVHDGNLTIRAGAHYWWTIPLDQIDDIHIQRRSRDNMKSVQYEHNPTGTEVHMGLVLV